MVVDVLRQDRTLAWDSEMLNISVRTSDSWCAHSLTTLPGIPSGPEAFRGVDPLPHSPHLCRCYADSREVVRWEGMVVLEASKQG